MGNEPACVAWRGMILKPVLMPGVRLATVGAIPGLVAEETLLGKNGLLQVGKQKSLIG